MTQAVSFYSFWEDGIYGQGQHLNRYPFDAVVSFVYRNIPDGIPRQDVRIVEIGCGAANNLWFAAREGFQVAGIDGSQSAIAYAKQRFCEEGLSGDLRVGDFTCLPFENASFDLAIDRGALTCCSLSAARTAVAEVHRVLRPSGRFLCSPFSDKHSSATSGSPGTDGIRHLPATGLFSGVEALCFYTKSDVERLFATGWNLLSLQHIEQCEMATPLSSVQAEWRVVGEKVGA